MELGVISRKLCQVVLLLLLSGFFAYSPTSRSVKVQSLVALATFISAMYFPTTSHELATLPKTIVAAHPIRSLLSVLIMATVFKYTQSKLRYARVNAIIMKHGYTDDPETWQDMSVETAQEIEKNIAEYEFPRLFQFAWILDFLRTSTDPGVSRAIISSNHIVSGDEFVEHERLQATIHLMSTFVAHKIKSPIQSLAIARINEHHHRYGTKINSDDVLYLVIHIGLAPVSWINRFGYRQLRDFEVHAMWVLWREIGCRMGVKYVPKTLEQAQQWRKDFEKECRWREDVNELMSTAMLNQIIYPVPSILQPFARKFVASILDWDVVYFCQLEKFGPSSVLRSVVFDIFRLCGWWIREFGFPRIAPYERSPSEPNKKTGLMHFVHTPYDSLPFYIEPTLWNLWGFGALVRRIRGMPVAQPKYYGNGVTIESMGVSQSSAETQAAVENKVRREAAALEQAPYGYRPPIGYQEGRLRPPVPGPSYGSSKNAFAENTYVIPASAERFEKRYERRTLGFSSIGEIDSPDKVEAFNSDE